jgi:predicted HAD superfamily Cof-like phosphohydrolase
MKSFLKKIASFNSIYRLPVNDVPTLPTMDDLKRFRSILQEELEEVDQIINQLELGVADRDHEIKLLTELADWHGDMIVYCHTNAHRYGLPMDEVLDVIMESNMSKLDANGQPIYDERGKVMKGPGYWKPEDRISVIIRGYSA